MASGLPDLPPRTRPRDDDAGKLPSARSLKAVIQLFGDDWSSIAVYLDNCLSEKMIPLDCNQQVVLLRELYEVLSLPENAVLFSQIAWDLVRPLWRHMHSERPAVRGLVNDLLSLTVEKGNSREVFLSLCALMASENMDTVQEEVWPPESSVDNTLAKALERCVARIETNRPTRILSEYTKAMLGLVHNMAITARSGSNDWLVDHLEASIDSGAIAGLRRQASSDTQELSNFKRLLLSFNSHLAAHVSLFQRLLLCEDIVKSLYPHRFPKPPTKQHQQEFKATKLCQIWFKLGIDIAELKSELDDVTETAHAAKLGASAALQAGSLLSEAHTTGDYADDSVYFDEESAPSVSSLGEDDNTPVALDLAGGWIMFAYLFCSADAGQDFSELKIQCVRVDFLRGYLGMPDPFVRDAICAILLVQIKRLQIQEMVEIEKSDNAGLLGHLILSLANYACVEPVPLLRHAGMVCARTLLDCSSDDLCYRFLEKELLNSAPDQTALRPTYIGILKDKIASDTVFWSDARRIADCIELALQPSKEYMGETWCPTWTSEVVELLQIGSFLIFLLQTGRLANCELARAFVNGIRSSQQYNRLLQPQSQSKVKEHSGALLKLTVDRLDALLLS